MKLVRSFFKITRIFWIISRLTLSLIFCYCAIFLLEAPDSMDYIAAGFFAITGLVLLWCFIAGLFRGGANKWFRIPIGTILIILGISMTYSTIDVFGMKEAAFLFFLPLWFFMAGLFEVIYIQSGSIKFPKAESLSVSPMQNKNSP
jgi:hypothetical protein